MQIKEGPWENASQVENSRNGRHKKGAGWAYTEYNIMCRWNYSPRSRPRGHMGLVVALASEHYSF